MNSERLIQILLAELNIENLKIQQDLEISINKVDKTDLIVNEVKYLLRDLAMNELSIAKLQILINNTKKNETDEK